MSIPLRTRTLSEARSFAPPTAARTRCENYATQRYRSHGTIENSLIQYDRPDGQAAKQSRVRLLEVGPDRALDEVLDAALHRDVVVTKQRVCGSTTSSFTLTRCPGSVPSSSSRSSTRTGPRRTPRVPGRRSHARRPSTPTRRITVPLPDMATYRLARRR